MYKKLIVGLHFLSSAPLFITNLLWPYHRHPNQNCAWQIYCGPIISMSLLNLWWVYHLKHCRSLIFTIVSTIFIIVTLGSFSPAWLLAFVNKILGCPWGSCSSSPNSKNQLVWFPNRETMGNNNKHWCVILFCDQWGNTLRAAPTWLARAGNTQ